MSPERIPLTAGERRGRAIAGWSSWYGAEIPGRGAPCAARRAGCGSGLAGSWAAVVARCRLRPAGRPLCPGVVGSCLSATVRCVSGRGRDARRRCPNPSTGAGAARARRLAAGRATSYRRSQARPGLDGREQAGAHCPRTSVRPSQPSSTTCPSGFWQRAAWERAASAGACGEERRTVAFR